MSMLVRQGTDNATALRLSFTSSSVGILPFVDVEMSKSTLPLERRVMVFSLPFSFIFSTSVTAKPLLRIIFAVPCVAYISYPSSLYAFAISAISGLSASRTDMSMPPDFCIL